MMRQGKIHYWMEQGMDSIWAFQWDKWSHGPLDLVEGKCPWEEMYCPVEIGVGPAHWSYAGTFPLAVGDKIRVYSDDASDPSTTIWEGVVTQEFLDTPRHKHPLNGLRLDMYPATVTRDLWE